MKIRPHYKAKLIYYKMKGLKFGTDQMKIQLLHNKIIYQVSTRSMGF